MPGRSARALSKTIAGIHMSLRVLVVDRLQEVARELEATACYAVLWKDGKLNWSDPIHVMRHQDSGSLPGTTLTMFNELAPKAKSSGSVFELTPGNHCLVLPVPFEGKRLALRCVV